MAMNKGDTPNTMASTAENQKESEKANARAPTAPAPMMAIVFSGVRTSPFVVISFLARWVMVQKRKRMANPLLSDSQIFRKNIDTCDALRDWNQQIKKIVPAAATEIRCRRDVRLIPQHAPQNNFLRSPSHGLPRGHQPAKSGFESVGCPRSPTGMPQCKIILKRLRADRSYLHARFVFQYMPSAHSISPR